MKKFQLIFINVFMLLFLLTGCNVYHTSPGNLSDALESDDRVRVVTKDNISFELKSLYQDGDELVGITAKKSEAAKKLNGYPHEVNGKNLKIRFQKDEILAVYLKNKKMSRWVNIGVPVVGAAGLITVTSKDFKPDMGY